MPQYYSGANPATSFSDGLMAGYEFVDRIKARREQLDMQHREQDRADAQLTLQQHADLRAQDDQDYQDKRRPIVDAQSDQRYADERTDRKFTLDERTRAVKNRDADEGARTAVAAGILSGQQGGGQQQVGDPGQPATPQAPNPGTAAQVPNASPKDAAVPAGPVDLRKAQADTDAQPGFFERAKNFVSEHAAKNEADQKTRNAASAWSAISDPNNQSSTFYFNDNPTQRAVNVQDIRRDPAKYAFKYAQDRDKVPAAARANLDMTFASALKDQQASISSQIQSLDPQDQRNAGKINSLTQELIGANNYADDLSKKITTSAAADGGITRPVKADDPRLVPAIVNASQNARSAAPIPVTSPDELRAATTMVNRVDHTKRLNSNQVKALTTLYTHGQITAEELTNWSKYGTPIAPKAPTVHAIGNGAAVVMTEDGQMSFIQAPGTGGKGGITPAQAQIRQKANMLSMYQGIEGAVKNGDLKGDPKQLFNEMMVTIGRSAAAVQDSRHVQLLDGDGAVRFDRISPTEAAELVDGYVKFNRGEVNTPWYRFGMPHDKPFQDYLPESPGSLSQGQNIDGYVYLGGDPNDENSWQAPDAQ